MRDLLVGLIIFGSLPLILWRPYIGVLVWSMISYMQPHRLAFGWALNFPFAAVVAGVFLIALVLTSDSRRLPTTRLVMIWLAFVAWQCVTTRFAMVPDAAWASLQESLKSQLLLFCALLIMRSRKRIDLYEACKYLLS